MFLYERILLEFKKKYNYLELQMITECDLLVIANRLCLVNEDREAQFLIETEDIDLLFRLYAILGGNGSIPMREIIERSFC